MGELFSNTRSLREDDEQINLGKTGWGLLLSWINFQICTLYVSAKCYCWMTLNWNLILYRTLLCLGDRTYMSFVVTFEPNSIFTALNKSGPPE